MPDADAGDGSDRPAVAPSPPRWCTIDAELAAGWDDAPPLLSRMTETQMLAAALQASARESRAGDVADRRDGADAGTGLLQLSRSPAPPSVSPILRDGGAGPGASTGTPHGAKPSRLHRASGARARAPFDNPYRSRQAGGTVGAVGAVGASGAVGAVGELGGSALSSLQPSVAARGGSGLGLQRRRAGGPGPRFVGTHAEAIAGVSLRAMQTMAEITDMMRREGVELPREYSPGSSREALPPIERRAADVGRRRRRLSRFGFAGAGASSRVTGAGTTRAIDGLPGASSILRALSTRHPVQRLEELQRDGVDVLGCRDHHKGSLMHMAARRGKLEVLEWIEASVPAARLAEMVGAPDDRGVQPLHVAADAGGTGAVLWLCERGADCNAVDGVGSTPLHCAAAGGKHAVCEALVAAGADCDLRDGQTGTALMLAALREDCATVECLAQLGADTDARTPRGYTPFLLAASRQSVPMIRTLARAGANLEATPGRTGTGWTALLTSAAKGYTAVVELLASLGASVECTDDLDSPAVFLAAQNGHLQTVQGLTLYGADLRKSVGGHNLVNYYAKQHPAVHRWCRTFGDPAMTKLHVAAALRRPDKVKALLRAGHAVHTLASPSPLELATDPERKHAWSGLQPRSVVEMLELATAPWSPRSHQLCGRPLRLRIRLIWQLQAWLDARRDATPGPRPVRRASTPRATRPAARPRHVWLPPELWQHVAQLLWFAYQHFEGDPDRSMAVHGN